MKNLFKFKNRNTDTVILWFFMFIIITLFLLITLLNKNIDNFTTYNKSINELKSINQDFDNFLLQKGTFINYDIINKRIHTFDENINFLSDETVLNNFPKEFQTLLEKVIKNYKIKHENIEYFKSENAQFLYSIHYLYSLNESISKSKNIDKKSAHTANLILLDLVKYFMHIELNTKKIRKNLLSLKSNNTNNKKIYMFNKHVEKNINRANKFVAINTFQEVENMRQSLNNLHSFLIKDYDKNILIKKIYVVLLFSMALVTLIILIVMNKRSIALRDELLGFRTAIENSYNSIIMTDLDRNITYVNERAQIESGYSKEELIGQNPRILKSGVKDENFYADLHEALAAGKKWEGEFINKKKNGSLYYEKSSIMPIFNHNEIVNFLAIKLNITDYIDEKHKVEYMAYHDALTGLPNRLNVEEDLKKRLPIARQNNSKLAILFIDLDRFKIINDTLGHDVGDALLIECAKRIKEVIGDTDTLARVGGDEFIIVVEPLENKYAAAEVSERILALFSKPLQAQSHLLNITLSIGISVFPDDSSDINCKQLFKYADIAMYEAKEEGKNNFQYYKKSLSIHAHNRLKMEQNLKNSLKNNEIYMMYQPQYTIKAKETVGIEALVRWHNNILGEVSPEQFIPIAEDTGFIISIGLFIFEQACRDFLHFKKYSKTLKMISINISSVQLYQDSFVDDICTIIDHVGITSNDITLEITETHIMKNIKYSKQILKQLKMLGFSISIDDFGTGYSSLSYLKEFPIDELKVDKSFVDNLPHNTDHIAITKSIITLSQSMGYTNVAEGIEHEEQEKFLEQNHCQIGQGYYFSKPLRKDDVVLFLQSKLHP